MLIPVRFINYVLPFETCGGRVQWTAQTAREHPGNTFEKKGFTNRDMYVILHLVPRMKTIAARLNP
jgi:uncharacterized protein YfaT (DUF1175 family)